MPLGAPESRTYLDYNATAPSRPEARAAVASALEVVGNPSSVHAEGRAARELVEEARRQVGRLAGAPPRCVTFTSGGTEAANLGLNPLAGSGRAEAPLDCLIVSRGEHACVLAGHRFPPGRVEVSPLGEDGRVDLDWLEAACRRLEGRRFMLALQGANNETGVIQPIAEAGALVHRRGGLLFCDAVQLAGRRSIDIGELGADFLILSAHKLGGPKGAGAFIRANPSLSAGAPLARGGGQERGLRSGTENVSGIAGFGAAARVAAVEAGADAARLARLRDGLVMAVRDRAGDAVIFGERAPRLANTLCFAVPGLDAASLMIALDLSGVAVSSGAACSSGKVARSHVLDAMGIEPQLASCAIRLSVGWASQEADVEKFRDAFAEIADRMRGRRGAA
jgi:cysteine desulfurase